MKVLRLPGCHVLAGLLLLTCSPSAHAAKVWTNLLSGFWQDGTNWLQDKLPDITSSVLITNDGIKTVTVNALTPASTLTIQILTMSAPPGATNTLLLSGAGLTNPFTIQTGLQLQDGAAVRITNSALVAQLTNDHVNLDGALTLDSGMIDFGDPTLTTRVGRATSGVLTINSGLVAAGTVTVGGSGNSTGAVNLNGGQLNLSSMFSIGRSSGTTGVVSIVGGQLSVPNDDTKVGDGGVGQMTLSNALALLTNVDVANDSFSFGTLTVQSGGQLLVSNAISVAGSSQSTGAVFVAGGQIVVAGNAMKVGAQGSGQFTLAAGNVQAKNLAIAAEPANGASGLFTMTGGSLNLESSLVTGGVSNSAGQVSFSGGDIEVTNAGHTAFVTVPNGMVALTGGTLTTDNLFLTNTTGQFLLNSGTLNTRATTASNGAPFVVGDGASPAVLHLNGGTHVFANGLVISSNATLNGCGTVVGQIINQGTIATNCGGLVVPRITAVSRSSSSSIVTISFTSAPSQTYTLEYKNAVSDTIWVPLAGATNGTGGVLQFQDPTATPQSRFYHVRTQ